MTLDVDKQGKHGRRQYDNEDELWEEMYEDASFR